MMFKLAVRFNAKLIGTHEFDKDHVTIGRAPDCDVVIDNLGVSRVHSQVERVGEVFVLRDLKSNNGTFVRGEKIQRYNLNNGDEFFLGKHSITFICEEMEEEALWQEEEEKEEAKKNDLQGMTMSMDERDLMLMQYKKHAVPAGYLTVNTASGLRQNLPITETATFFGTHSRCKFKIEGWFYSKRHAVVLREDTGFRLIHLGNKKPPKVNGKEVDDHKLQQNDVLEVGEYKMTFNLGTPQGDHC